MKFTVMGFSQAKLIELGLDTIDVTILRWIIDFYHTDAMKKIEVKGKHYFWIHYQTVLDELPILKIKNKNTLARRLEKLVKAGILEKYIDKEAGNYTYFRIIEEGYKALITSTKEGGYLLKSRKVSTQNEKGYLLKSRNIYSSTNDSSISIKEDISDFEKQILEKLQRIEIYPYQQEKDLQLIREIWERRQISEAEMLDTVDNFAIYCEGPYRKKKNKNPRLTLKNFFRDFPFRKEKKKGGFYDVTGKPIQF